MRVQTERVHGSGEQVGQQTVEPSVTGDRPLPLERLADDDELEVALRPRRHVVAAALVDDVEAGGRELVDDEVVNLVGD